MPPLQTFRTPQALHPGDSVAVIAPASSFDRASFEAGLAVLAERYRLKYDERILDRHRYFAGTDERRLEELVAALTDPDIKAVFCARGGYGAMRLLPSLARLTLTGAPVAARSGLPQRPTSPGASTPAILPKPLVGFSDITALHLWLQTLGLRTIHGPVMTQLARVPARTPQRLFSMLESGSPAEPLSATATYVGGVAEGPLLGGNLSVFTRLLGTPFMPPLEGAILLLEDVSERPYRLDRMWTHLELAGVFRKIRGIALGLFIGCEEKDADFTSADVLRELAAATGLPCAAGFPIGHGDVNEPVPLGARVRLDADSRTLTFLEPAVSA